MRLIITRHGETEENKAGIMQGHLPGTLSSEGIAQAKKVALRLKNEKIDIIFSSDLARASDTAKEIARYHPDTPIIFVKELRERNLGEFQGKKKSDFGWDKNDYKTTYIEPKEGESIQQLFYRAKNFLNKTISEYPSNNILFVGHNGISKALIAVITNKNPDDVRSIENQHNTSISIFDIYPNKNHKIHLFNDITHLN